MTDAESTDETLAGHHVYDLSWRHQQVAVGCASLQTDEEMAEALCLTESTVRRHIADAIHRVFDPIALEGSRTLLGRWCGHHWDCCVRSGVDLSDQKFAQGDQPRPRFPHIRWIRRRGRRRIHESGNSTNDHPLHGGGRWTGRWHGLALAGTVVALGVLVGLGVAHATFISDSEASTHNGCYYAGYSSYSTGSDGRAQSQTQSSCAVATSLSAYLWNPQSGQFDMASLGWVIGRSVVIEDIDGSTLSIYGYHQIQQPMWSQSTPLETHAE